MAKKVIRRVGKRGIDREEVEERGGNSSGDANTEQETSRALTSMAKGEKPRISDDEPEDKNSIQYLAWKRRQKNLGKSMGL